MFHEVGHIFLGLIKAQNRNAYRKLVENYKKANIQMFSKFLSGLKQKYLNMSDEDYKQLTQDVT